jgi:hypothetical protein
MRDHLVAATAELAAAGDPAHRIAALHRAHDAFLTGDGAAEGLRDLVADSWERSVAAGVDPDADGAPVQLTDDELAEHRDRHPLASVLPVFRDLLGPVVDGGHLMAVSDAGGRLLWVEGPTEVLRHAERMNFVPGATWAERSAGTNAPGTALALGRPVQIFAAEHFSRVVQRWTCSAAPIQDPATGELIGSIDLTGGQDLATAASLALVRATALAVAGELAASGLWTPRRAGRHDSVHGEEGGGEHGSAGLTLQVLGRDEGLLTHGGQQRRLSRRHSEILTVLAQHPEGASGERLGLQLYGDDANPITLRAEMSRLRQLLGSQLLCSRPYRLQVTVEADVFEVTRLLDRGEVRAALRRYPGPLLPQSEAPAIARLRSLVEQQLRHAVLASADPGLLVDWSRTPHGHDDLRAWETLARVAPYGAVRSMARQRVTELGAELTATYLQPRRT